MPATGLDVAAARVALSPKPAKEERRQSTAELIAKIPFLQRSGSVASQHRDGDHNNHPSSNTFPSFHHESHEQEPRRHSALAEVFDHGGLRTRRKSSLRKTVLQTSGRLRLDHKSSKDAVLQQTPAPPRSPTVGSFSNHRPSNSISTTTSSYIKSITSSISPTKQKATFELPRSQSPYSTSSYPESLISRSQLSTSPTNFSALDDNASTIGPDDSASNVGQPRSAPIPQKLPAPTVPLSPPLGSPDTLRAPRPRPSPSPSPPSSETSSSLPTSPPTTQSTLSTTHTHHWRTRSHLPHQHQPSPLISSATDALLAAVSPSSSPEDTWDYTSTAWWGYLILLNTWLVFVVGMGSCFGVWSWAWDVGNKPYAPPEFEDDPTLPIVGYYPALMVLTGVMSWVWVVVAWVGMKYFKHAKIGSED